MIARMRIAVFDNLANSAYIVTKMLRRLGHEAELVLDPVDRHVMSDPRWEDLDLELPTDQLVRSSLPPAELPCWVRADDRAPGRAAQLVRLLAAAPRASREVGLAARLAGWRGALMALDR